MGKIIFKRELIWISDLFSSLLIFTIIKTILSTFFFTVSKFYKNLVKWALTVMLCSVAGTTTLDREWCSRCCHCLWIVHPWLLLRFYPMLINNTSLHQHLFSKTNMLQNICHTSMICMLSIQTIKTPNNIVFV